MNNCGLYIHIPFCKSKCPYCDFYSGYGEKEEIDRYIKAAARQIREEKRLWGSVFFGGGTPSLLNKENWEELMYAIGETSLSAEITAEVNPGDVSEDYLKMLKEVGINRLSIGAQSLNDKLLLFLGRRHTAKDIQLAVDAAKKAGFENISLDFMLGLPNQTAEDIKETVKFLKEKKIPHVSAYILKVEEGTPFFKNGIADLLDEDDICEKYLLFCSEIEKVGFSQYEISNFSLSGKESKHNLKYWKSEPYLGIGPGAHSFLNGKRFFIEPNRKAYIEKIEAGISPFTGFEDGGDFKEYAMLRLRLKEGLDLKTAGEREKDIRKKASVYIKAGLMEIEENRLRFTRTGFLLSNTIISNLIF